MTLYSAAHACLRAATPDDKLALSFATADAFARGELAWVAPGAAARIGARMREEGLVKVA